MSMFKARVGKALNRLQKQLRSDEVDAYAKETDLLITSLETYFEHVSTEYNTTIMQEPLMVTVRRQALVPDERGFNTRIVVATSYWALTIRGSLGFVECFILPATELMTLPDSELPSRAKLILQLTDLQRSAWVMNNVVVSSDELSAIMRALIKDVIARSKDAFDNMPESVKIVAGGQSFAGSIRSLLAEKHALVQKIVDQQEAIQGQLARELHDSVLGNVMLLRRSLSGQNKMADDEVIAVLDEISHRLREVCQDLSPRDLKDLGLQPILEELCHNLEARTECECVFECATPIPEFPEEVSLHIYRIAQECFNNIANHASATMVRLTITIKDDLFTMSVADNGVGFDAGQPVPSRRAKEGGTGAGIIKERAELISYVYPAKVWVESQPGKGTRTSLAVTMSPVDSEE